MTEIESLRAEVARLTAERDALRVDADSMTSALLAWLGPVDDPKAGWLGGGGTAELFACEYCNAKHADCTQVPHSATCPIQNARTVIDAARAAKGN